MNQIPFAFPPVSATLYDKNTENQTQKENQLLGDKGVDVIVDFKNSATTLTDVDCASFLP